VVVSGSSQKSLYSKSGRLHKLDNVKIKTLDHLALNHEWLHLVCFLTASASKAFLYIVYMITNKSFPCKSLVTVVTLEVFHPKTDRIKVLVQIKFFAKCFVTVVTLEVVIPKLDRIGVLVQIRFGI
jgi:hypothetical protein